MLLIAHDWLRDHWWVFALRGVLLLVFGILAALWPGLTLAALILLFGAFALVDGTFTLVGAVLHRESQWGWHVIDGLAGVIIGVVTLVWPGLTAVVLLALIAVWSIVFGLIRLVMAIRTRHVAEHPWLLGIAGAASVLFGAAIVLLPVEGALAITWLIGVYAIFIGALMLLLGIRLRLSPAAALGHA